MNDSVDNQVDDGQELKSISFKDYLRIGVFFEHKVVNSDELQNILAKYNLADKWQSNINKFQV